MKWLRHKIKENGTKPNNENVTAMLELKHPENQKQLKSFLGAIQHLATFLPELSERTDRLGQLQEKNTEWKSDEEQERDFTTIKEMLIEERG